MPRNPKRHLKAPETTLYAPVKRYLERRGFTVKGEVCGCDLVALRGEEPPIVVVGELKSAFSLELVLQGVNRTAACDEVWLRSPWSRSLRSSLTTKTVPKPRALPSAASPTNRGDLQTPKQPSPATR